MDIKQKCIDLLVKKRGNECYRNWATGQVNNWEYKKGNLEGLLESLKANKIKLELSPEFFGVGYRTPLEDQQEN